MSTTRSFSTKNPVGVTTEVTEIVDFVVHSVGSTKLAVEVVHQGGDALTDFIVQLKDHPKGEWYNYLGGVDFDATDESSMIFCTTNGPHELTTGQVAHFHVKIGAGYAVRLVAQSAGLANIEVRGNYGQSE